MAQDVHDAQSLEPGGWPEAVAHFIECVGMDISKRSGAGPDAAVRFEDFLERAAAIKVAHDIAQSERRSIAARPFVFETALDDRLERMLAVSDEHIRPAGQHEAQPAGRRETRRCDQEARDFGLSAGHASLSRSDGNRM